MERGGSVWPAAALNFPSTVRVQDGCRHVAAGIPFGDTSAMKSVQPDNTDPMPLRPIVAGMGTIMIRFVGLLVVAVVVLALIWSR